MISFQEARKQVLAEIKQLPSERCALSALCGRILAEDITALSDIPPHDNTSVDGFAVRAQDIASATPDNPVVLTVIEDIPAGKVPHRSVAQGEAVRIMTGAPLPEGADCIVMVEDTDSGSKSSREKCSIYKAGSPGDNVRERGEDVRAGQRIIAKGIKLRPQEVGIIASLGKDEALVAKKPVVAIISSGNEIAMPGQPLQPGQIYDANSFTLANQAEEAGAVPRNYGIVADNLTAVVAALKKAAQECDIIVTSGGVSVGDYDLMKEALASLGEMHFWQVRQKPGKPLAFGYIKGKPVVGLPGNPVSAMVIFAQYVRPILGIMLGLQEIFSARYDAVCEEKIKKSKERVEFLRAHIWWQDCTYHARLTGPQGSGILNSMVMANGLIILPEGTDVITAGTRVPIEFF